MSTNLAVVRRCSPLWCTSLACWCVCRCRRRWLQQQSTPLTASASRPHMGHWRLAKSPTWSSSTHRGLKLFYGFLPLSDAICFQRRRRQISLCCVDWKFILHIVFSRHCMLFLLENAINAVASTDSEAGAGRFSPFPPSIHYLFSFPVFKVFTLIYLHFLLLPRGISLFFPFASLWFRCLLIGVQGKTRFKINEVQSGSKTTTIRGSCKLGAKSTKNYAQNWNIILARASLIFLHHPTPQLSKHTPWTAVYNPSSSITMLRRSQQC